VIIDDASGNNDILAAKPSLHLQEQTKEGLRAGTTSQDLTTANQPVPGTELWFQEESYNTQVKLKATTEPQSLSGTQSSSRASMAGPGPIITEPGLDMAMNLDTTHASAGGHEQNRGEYQASSSSLSAHNLTNAAAKPTPAGRSPINPSEAHLDTPNATIANDVRETDEAAISPLTTASGSHVSPPKETSVLLPAAPAVTTAAKTQQEITLDELRAQKSALLASLAALPAIRVLMEENASSDVSMTDVNDEATEADIMAAANKIVKEHIKLLHEYNELKDVGQGLMGLIADQRGVRIVEVQEEFGIEAQD
jgi:hypothetical protein